MLNCKKVLSLGATFLSVGTFIALAACSSVQHPPNPYGIEHEVAHSKESRPKWIDNMRAYQKSHPDRKYFVGEADHEFDMEGGRTDAVANAQKGIATTIKNTVHNLYIKARTVDATQSAGSYNADTQQAIEDGTLQVANGIITGAQPDRFWWRRYWIQTSPGAPVEYFNDVYVLESMSKADYQQTIYQTLNGVKKVVQAPKAHRVIKTMKNLWLKQNAG
ncbi:MAG: hypothetical protein ACYCT9_03960 [Leptospirillum sp.]